eukprot:CAMPEP_0177587888 /NCGR_PEP_ID=MMETSP0419_2-20121207/5910_1 /TAXON_ID=582737 /ORGANISM="Tetraselmis sp., Strain GSL018" /LENGTH=773 /DNA_ID=CAMNT_0019078005 /DNA_START=166 /DNA_END=2484 /DNA_ORIENTATION=+
MSSRVNGSSLSKPPAKKLVIKPLKKTPQLPPDFEDSTWEKLKETVHAIHAKQRVSSSREELYRAVEEMCLHKMAPRLYNRLQEVCDEHIGKQLSALREKTALGPVPFLDSMAVCWSDHCEQMFMIRSIFLYLDRTYVISTSSVKSLFDMGLQLFRTHLASCSEVQSNTVTGLLQLIEAERKGETVNRGLLKHLLRMFSSLGIYTECFESVFLEQTAQFYSAEGELYLSQSETADYLLHTEKRLQEEYERCKNYLDTTTRKPLIGAVERQLLEKHMAEVFDRGVPSMLDRERLDDLRRLYSLSSRVAALDALKVAFHSYIRTKGGEIVMDEDKDGQMVGLLLQMKKRLDAVLAESFQGNESFVNALKDAFEQFINRRPNKPAELIAKFVDSKLRTGNKGLSDEELENMMDDALVLFRYIQGKDVFEAFYKKDLAKRLLLNKSASIDAEKSMISKLKAECGSQFTSKLEGMFKDIDLSREIMGQFKSYAESRSKESAKTEMNVSVLTSGYWPTYPVMDAKLPEELNRYQEVFKEFYLSKHSGRRLVWCNTLGSCVVRTQFPNGVKELSVSLLQTVVLMLFNDADVLSFQDIADATGIEDKELRRTLQSLACGKMRVLLKEPKGREVEDGDQFSFNTGFSEKLFRIKINSIQLKETDEENKKTNDQVLQDRQYQIDAAIVRVMKTRRTLSHRLLIQELITMLKFNIKGSDLKKRIESLIDREYLERDKNEPTVVFVAIPLLHGLPCHPMCPLCHVQFKLEPVSPPGISQSHPAFVW